MKKYSFLILSVLIAAGFSTCSLAAKPATPAGGPALTPEQIATIKANRQANRAAMDSQRAQMKSLTDQLKTELQRKPVDQNRVSYLTKQIDIQRDSMQVQQLQMMMQMRPNMKPAEKKRYNDQIQRAQDRLAKRQSAK